MANAIATVGVISDTHGLLRDTALAALAGSDLIIHAGDVDTPEILERLRSIARVVAVRGNIDKGALASVLPYTALAQAGDALIYVIHDVHELDRYPAPAGVDIVISGHSHQPSRTERSGVMYLNPGSAGPRRFSLPITLARLQVNPSPWTVDFIGLE